MIGTQEDGYILRVTEKEPKTHLYDAYVTFTELQKLALILLKKKEFSKTFEDFIKSKSRPRL